ALRTSCPPCAETKPTLPAADGPTPAPTRRIAAIPETIAARAVPCLLLIADAPFVPAGQQPRSPSERRSVRRAGRRAGPGGLVGERALEPPPSPPPSPPRIRA